VSALPGAPPGDAAMSDAERAGGKMQGLVQELLVHSEGAQLAGLDSETGNARDAMQGAGQGRKRFYKSLSHNCWTTEDGEEEGRAQRGGEADITTPWHCEVCNIYFTSSQALGGHRMNSTDHRVRAERLKNAAGAGAAALMAPSTPRLSLHVYSNDESVGKTKRTRMPPMAQVPTPHSEPRTLHPRPP